KRDITQLVSANGKVQPEVEVKISPEVAGEITELPVKVGQAVKKGDLLMKIKPDTYVAQVEQKEAMIRSSRALNSQQEAQMAKTKQDLVRARALFTQKITSDADILTAETAYTVAKAVFEASLSDIKRAESDLSQVRDMLEKTVIISPIDGVISVLNSQQGERVVATGQFAGTEVMRVADFNVMEIRVQVNENDIPLVKMGDPVGVSIDSFSGRPFRGTVSQIANSATTTGAGTQEEVTNFEVRVRVDAQGAALRPGMSGTADIETKTVKGVVAVPIQSVTVRERGTKISPEERDKAKAKDTASADNSTELYNDRQQAAQKKAEREKSTRVVFVKKGDKAEMREVETGISDNSHIEMKKGVAVDEEVISGPYRAVSRTLKDGAKVVLEKIPAAAK
ncbi:efflux transporter periplasmic adaptor subunit, partial [Verrucomicrobia bacterium SCGC AG-212-E04]